METSEGELRAKDRSTLEEYRITYVEEILPAFQNETADGKEAPVKLPAHVESLREALLYFGPLLPGNRKAFFEKEGKQYASTSPGWMERNYSLLPPQAAYFPTPQPGSKTLDKQKHIALTKINEAREKSARAREFTAVRVSKATWQTFLEANVFKAWEDVISPNAYE